LGISVQAMTAALATALKSPDTKFGTLVTAVEADGPSANTLRVGDVILSVNKVPVNTAILGKVMARLRPGSSADAVVVRNGAQQSISLTVGQLPDPPINPTMSGEADTWVQNLELAVANSTNAIRKALKADEDNGLVVTQLRRLGAGGLAGLRIGDLITHAGSQPLQRVAELASVAPPSPQEPLLLRIVRGGSPRFVAVTGIEDRQPLDTQ
jgi:serine protease Do